MTIERKLFYVVEYYSDEKLRLKAVHSLSLP